MSTIITQVSSVVTAAVGWVGDFAGAIVAPGNEILLVGIALAIAGFGVGLLKRLVQIR